MAQIWRHMSVRMAPNQGLTIWRFTAPLYRLRTVLTVRVSPRLSLSASCFLSWRYRDSPALSPQAFNQGARFYRTVSKHSALLGRLSPLVTRDELEKARTANGGYSRRQLEEWGVPWPPPKGWKQVLLTPEDSLGTDSPT